MKIRKLSSIFVYASQFFFMSSYSIYYKNTFFGNYLKKIFLYL